MGHISKRLEEALAALGDWPIERQEEAAKLLERMHKLASTPYLLEPDERADLEEALAEVQRGEFASDREVDAVFQRLDQ